MAILCRKYYYLHLQNLMCVFSESNSFAGGTATSSVDCLRTRPPPGNRVIISSLVIFRLSAPVNLDIYLHEKEEKKGNGLHFSDAYLVVPKNFLKLLFRNAHSNAVGAVDYEYDGMNVAVQNAGSII